VNRDQNRQTKPLYSQVKANKTFWETYGKLVLIGIIAIFGAVIGRQYLEYKSQTTASEASRVYDAVLVAVRKKEYTKANELGMGLIQNFKNTPYAALTALLLARGTFDQGNLEATEKNLRTALSVAEPGAVQHIATVRLARVLASQNKTDEALKLLNDAKSPGNYKTLYEEAKGDIYVKRQDLEKARVAYALALKSAPEGVPVPWLQLKQSDLSDESIEKAKTVADAKTLDAPSNVPDVDESKGSSTDKNKTDSSKDDSKNSGNSSNSSNSNNADSGSDSNSDSDSNSASNSDSDSDPDSDAEPGSETNE